MVGGRGGYIAPGGIVAAVAAKGRTPPDGTSGAL